VSGLHCSIPNGVTGPGNVSTCPTTAPPAPVPMSGLTRLAGSSTGVTLPAGVAAAARAAGLAALAGLAGAAEAAGPSPSPSAALAPAAATAITRLVITRIG